MDVCMDVDWKTLQFQDSNIRPWMERVLTGDKPKKGQMPRSPLFKMFDRLSIEDGILYREVTLQDQIKKQLILPSVKIPTVLQLLHDEMGHPGRERTSSLIKERFYWPGMSRDIEQWITTCDRCIKRKAQPDRAPLVSITSTQPLELICIDFLSLEQSKGGQQNILVVTDHFTRYAQAYPTRNQTAKTTADVLFNQFIVHYGIPKRIHSDQGANFESNLIKELCKLIGSQKSRTTPYHPMGNGMTERFNRTLLNMLGTLDPNQKLNWKSHVATLVHSYNCIKHESTGQSPYFLMFGREPNLPIDIAFGLVKEKSRKPQTKYVKELRERLLQAYDLAFREAEKMRNKQKDRYDQKSRGAVLEVGDRVLVRTVHFEGKHKLANNWEDMPYIILSQPNPEVPVYVVQKQNGEGKKRTLHRNLMYPIGFISERPIPVPRPRARHSISTPVTPRLKPQGDRDEDNISTISDDSRILVMESESNISTNIENNDIQEPIHEEGSASEQLDESEERDSEANEVMEDFGDDADATDEDETVPILPRRSSRVRQAPNWMSSGDFITKSNISDKMKWQEKSDFILNFLKTTSNASISPETTDFVVKHVLNF